MQSPSIKGSVLKRSLQSLFTFSPNECIVIAPTCVKWSPYKRRPYANISCVAILVFKCWKSVCLHMTKTGYIVGIQLFLMTNFYCVRFSPR